MAVEKKKVIYSMIGVSKFYDKKPVLKDINLSYFYGAKIGVLGLNGSGKSSLLRILAGVDRDFVGKTSISPGLTVGLLEQEPLLDDDKTVRQIVEKGVQETVDLLDEFNRINEKFAEPMTDDERFISTKKLKLLLWSISAGVVVAFFFASNFLDMKIYIFY